MRVEIKTTCDANVYETWEVHLPDGLAEAELRDAALEVLWNGNAELIEEEHDGERDRQIISVHVLRD